MSSIEVREMTDAAQVVPLLEKDRLWSAYALCDLEPPFSDHSRFLLAFDGTNVVSAVMGHSLQTFTSVHAFGRGDGIGRIMMTSPSLPSEIGYQFREEDMDALRARYEVQEAEMMYRMAVHPETFQPPRPVPAEIRRLAMTDGHAVKTLYSHFGSEFAPEALSTSLYFGAFAGGELMAVAGTHCHSVRRSIGAVGGVFTHPDHRGQGLATAVTGSVVQALIDLHIRDIILNVKADNAPAVAAYRRLGFTVHRTMFEGRATLRANSR